MASLKDLPKEDEYYGISFLQAETIENEETGEVETQSREVKVATYSLMDWWKRILGNEDTIEISEGSEHAMLTYTMTMNDLDDDIADEISTDAQVFIEVYEQYYPNTPVLTFYCYPQALAGLSAEMTEALVTHVSAVNLEDMIFGNFELNVDENGGGQVRYKSSLCLKGISVGKANAIASFVAISDTQLQMGLCKLIRRMN